MVVEFRTEQNYWAGATMTPWAIMHYIGHEMSYYPSTYYPSTGLLWPRRTRREVLTPTLGQMKRLY